MKYLQNQESFSFSTSSSKAGLSSDDEDRGAEGGRTSSHQQNGYFEISLPPPPPPPLPSIITKTNHNEAKEEEFEFCFSFNSNSTLLDFPTSISGNSNHPFHHREPPLTTPALTSSQLVKAIDGKYKNHKKINNSIHYKRVFQKASSPRCHHQGSISPYVFPTSRLRTFDKNHRELVKNRNSAKFGGIRKFMVKLRSIDRMLRSSLTVSRQLPLPMENVNKTNAVNQKPRDCTHMTTIRDDNIKFVANSQSQNRNQEAKKPSRMINFNGFNKFFDVIMKNIRTSQRSKQTDSKSCPESIISSPMHDVGVGNTRDERRNSFYSGDHSIQSAIAHCKKSFGK